MSDELERVKQLLSKAQTYLKARRFDVVVQLADQAIARIEKALGIGIDLGGQAPDEIDREIIEEHVSAFEIRGMAKRHLGQLESGIQDLFLAAELRRKLTEDEELPSNELAVALHNLGNALLTLGREPALTKAREVYTEAIGIREFLMKTPGHGHVAEHLAGSCKARANVESLRARKGLPADLAGARADLERALGIRGQLVEVDGRKEFAGALAMTKYSLGDLLGIQFQFGPAVRYLAEAAASMQALTAAGQRHLRDDLALCLSARVLYGIGAAEIIPGSAWPIDEAILAAKTYIELIGEGRADQAAPFGEFVSQRLTPCLYKAGRKDLAAHWLAQAMKSVLDQAAATGDEGFVVSAAAMLALPSAVRDELRSSSPELNAQIARLS